jgi:hypothetical protein
MSNLTKNAKTIPAVRTYAKDLEEKRAEKGLPTEAVNDAAPKVTKIEAPVNKKMPEIKKAPAPRIPTFSAVPIEKSKTPPKPPKKMERVGSTTFIVDNEDAAEATVITDQKHDRFKLFPAVFVSLKKWFEEKKRARAAKKQPKYTVPDTSRRKGVIQKATSSTGKFATADFESIQERIRKRNEMKAKPEPTTTWTPNTEPGFLLLTGEATQPVTNVQLVSRKSYKTQAPVTPVVRPELIVATEPVAPVEVLPEPAEEIYTEEKVVEEVIEAEAPEERTKGKPENYEENPEDEVNETNKDEGLPEYLKLMFINTNILAVGVSGLILALVGFIFFTYYRVADYNESAPIVTTTKSSIGIEGISVQNLTALNLEESSLISVINGVRGVNPQTTQYELVSQNGNRLQPSFIINALGIELEQNFKQSVSELLFGYTARENPFIVMQIKDKTTALGGLLSWETNIFSDFNNTFGNTSTNNTEAKFIDGTIQGNDIRILKGESGAELLVYGLVGNVVLIASDSSDFNELLNINK